MATITEPAATRAVAVQTRQALRLVADASTNWWRRTNGGAWVQIGTGVAELVWETPGSVVRRFTFDEIDVAAQDAQPVGDVAGALELDLCEGPVAVLRATDQAPNPAAAEPALDPNAGEDDDGGLGMAWFMPAANRDGFGTLSPGRGGGGPANLVQSFRVGLFVDTAGKLGSRSQVLGRVSGLGPFLRVRARITGECTSTMTLGSRVSWG